MVFQLEFDIYVFLIFAATISQDENMFPSFVV